MDKNRLQKLAGINEATWPSGEARPSDPHAVEDTDLIEAGKLIARVIANRMEKEIDRGW